MRKFKIALLVLLLPMVPVSGWMSASSTLHDLLIAAVKADDTAFAVKLIKMGADVNSRTSKNGWSALHYAVRNGNAEVVQVLLAAGADPNYVGTMEGQAHAIVSEKPMDLAKAALDLVNQVPASRIEATLHQAGLDDPALVKSMRDEKAASRYQKVVDALAQVKPQS
jgi:ankyrin repeat protein